MRILLACALALGSPMARAAAPIELAAGVYMVQGSGGEPDAANLGRIGNAGFIVGPRGVLAIDTGTSYENGRALLDAIRGVTDLPVRLVLITHARPEFIFGAAAFRERGIPVAMQAAAADLMAARCADCLGDLRKTLGEAAMRGSTTFTPDIRFADPAEIDAATPIGRPIQVLYYGHASGPGDVAVYDPRSRTLFAGGLLESMRIPDVLDADIGGWTDALSSLEALPAEVIVPGHGRAGSPRMIGSERRYLDLLASRSRSLLASGVPLSAVPDASALPEFAAWDQYETVHRRNAALVFLRLERAQLLEQADKNERPR